MGRRATASKVAEMLYTTAQVRGRIREVMSGPGRRVAVVAFVGEHADAYVRKSSGLEVYCWPQGASTSASMVRRLIDEGASVRFVDRLHMKVYWSAKRGAVVTSANLSTNALGAGDLKEAGVYLRRGVDIDRLLRGLVSREVTEKELEKLAARNKAARKSAGARRSGAPTFLEWYRSPRRARWMLAATDGYAPPSKAARQAADEDRGTSDVEDAITVGRGSIKADEFVLVLDCVKGRPASVTWLYVHRVVSVGRSEKAYNRLLPQQAIQIYPLRTCRPPPFAIDRTFRRVVRAIDWTDVGNEWPKPALVRRLAESYDKVRRNVK